MCQPLAAAALGPGDLLQRPIGVSSTICRASIASDSRVAKRSSRVGIAGSDDASPGITSFSSCPGRIDIGLLFPFQTGIMSDAGEKGRAIP
jgi:hypothetical protein